MSIAAINAACVDFYRLEPRDPGATANVAQMQAYARQRIEALSAGLAGASAVRLRRADRQIGQLIRNNFSSARAIYEQLAELAPDTPSSQASVMMDSAHRLVVDAAVALIAYGATSCAPPSDEPAAPPGTGAGRLLTLAPTAVVSVTPTLLDNKSIAVDRHAVWVAVARAPSVVRIDPTTNRVVTEIALPGQITQQIQIVGNNVWIPTQSTLVRVDESTNRIDWQINLGSLAPPDSAFTVNGRTLWLCDRDVLHRVDIPTRRRASDVRLPGGCQTLTTSGNHITVSYGLGNRHTVVARIDAATGASGPTILLPTRSVWGLLETPTGRVFVDSGSVRELDVAHGRVLHSIVRGGNPGNQLALAGDGLWMTRPDEQRLVRYDLKTNRLEEVKAGPGVNGVAALGTQIWATNSDAGTVMRFSYPNGPGEATAGSP